MIPTIIQQLPTTAVRCARLSHDKPQPRVAFGADDGVIHVYHFDSRSPIAQLRSETCSPGCTALCFHPQQSHKILCGNELGVVCCWDMSTESVSQRWSRRHVDNSAEEGIVDIDVHSSGTHAASVTHDGELRLWDVRQGTPRTRVYRDGKEALRAVRFARTGSCSWLATGCAMGTVRVYNLTGGKLHARLTPSATSSSAVTCLCFHPEMDWLAVGSGDGSVAVWDVNTCRPVVQAFLPCERVVADVHLDYQRVPQQKRRGGIGQSCGVPTNVHKSMGGGGVASVCFGGTQLLACTSHALHTIPLQTFSSMPSHIHETRRSTDAVSVDSHHCAPAHSVDHCSNTNNTSGSSVSRLADGAASVVASSKHAMHWYGQVADSVYSSCVNELLVTTLSGSQVLTGRVGLRSLTEQGIESSGAERECGIGHSARKRSDMLLISSNTTKDVQAKGMYCDEVMSLHEAGRRVFDDRAGISSTLVWRLAQLRNFLTKWQSGLDGPQSALRFIYALGERGSGVWLDCLRAMKRQRLWAPYTALSHLLLWLRLVLERAHVTSSQHTIAMAEYIDTATVLHALDNLRVHCTLYRARLNEREAHCVTSHLCMNDSSTGNDSASSGSVAEMELHLKDHATIKLHLLRQFRDVDMMIASLAYRSDNIGDEVRKTHITLSSLCD